MLRYLSYIIDARTPRERMIYILGLVAMFVLIGLWGLQYRPSAPPPPTTVRLPDIELRGALPFGATASGTLPEGKTLAWTHDAAAGTRLTLRLTTAFPAVLRLTAPDGRALAEANVSFGETAATICARLLETAGPHRVTLAGFPGAPGRNFGAYTLAAQPAEAAPPPPVTETTTTAGGVSVTVTSRPCP